MMAYTIGVNHTFLQWPCDIVVALDPQFVVDHVAELKQAGIPVVTRDYPAVQNRGLDLILVPTDTIVKYLYSGILAAKIGDSITRKSEGRGNYVIGIDGGTGRYTGHPGDGPCTYEKATNEAHEAIGLTHTKNLSMHSKVKCWPKYSKLPRYQAVVVDETYRRVVTAFIRGEILNLI
jgi:hypothetical protein